MLTLQEKFQIIVIAAPYIVMYFMIIGRAKERKQVKNNDASGN